MEAGSEILVFPRGDALSPKVERRLQDELARCPDLAFAHVPRVQVPAHQDRPAPVLFVWLEPGALRSLRSALNLVTEAVSRALPNDEFLDVVVLNSAPELLAQVEAADSLLVENNPEERHRAIQASSVADVPDAGRRQGPWWWPFSS